MAYRGTNVRCDCYLLEASDDNKQTDEHDKKRPVNLNVNLFRFHSPREQKICTANNGHLGDRLAEEEQHDHNRHNDNGLRQEWSMVVGGCDVGLFKMIIREKLTSIRYRNENSAD